jgi:hypothetical protein
MNEYLSKFFAWMRSLMQEGTPDSMARLVFFMIGIVTAVVFLIAMLFSLWSHYHDPKNVYDLPRNLTDGMRDIFIAAGAGKVVQRIFGEGNTPAPAP